MTNLDRNTDTTFFLRIVKYYNIHRNRVERRIDIGKNVTFGIPSGYHGICKTIEGKGDRLTRELKKRRLPAVIAEVFAEMLSGEVKIVCLPVNNL